jgi:hypothetical protein
VTAASAEPIALAGSGFSSYLENSGMLSRALSLATVTLLIGGFAAAPAPALAQQNLEAGKSPAQIFAGACTACHKGPRGLLKTVPAGSLQSFLRQHYTTSPDMATLLSTYLTSNGAADTRYAGTQGKPARDEKKDEKLEAKPSGLMEQVDRLGRRLRPAPSQQEAAKPDAEEEAKPDSDGASPQAEPGRRGHNARRLGRTGEAPDGAKPPAEGQAAAMTTDEHGPEGRRSSAKQRLSKRGRTGGEEPPKVDARREEPAKGGAKGEAVKQEAVKSDSPKVDSDKPEGAKPSGDGKSESAGVEPGKEGGGEPAASRPDPVPPVTPAPPASPAVTAAVSGATSEPAADSSVLAVRAAAPTVTASVPPPPPPPLAPPVAPAGPPVPPISQ